MYDIYNPQENVRQSTPIPSEENIMQNISIKEIPPDIRHFDPANPTIPISTRDNVHRGTQQITHIHQDQLDPISSSQLAPISSSQSAPISTAQRPSASRGQLINFYPKYCQAQPQSQLQLGCSWFYSQLLCPACKPTSRPTLRNSTFQAENDLDLKGKVVSLNG